jgi:sugar lactone lactonase YvrE
MNKRTLAELVLRAQSLNGESPAWDQRERCLFWVDIRESTLHRFDPGSGEDRAWTMPAWIGCFALDGHGGAVVALRTGLYRFDFASGCLAAMAYPPFDPRRFIFNDGRCDPWGRFLAGPMYLPLRPGDQSGEAKAAPLWRYDGGGTFSSVTDPVRTSNGLAWSPDGRVMYHSDTDAKTIWAYDYDLDAGKPSNKRVFAQVEVADKSGGPDGAAVDRDGFYWCAVFANHCLLRFDPEGKLERRVEMPVKYPAMPAFGGPNLQTVFVTSANWPIPPGDRSQHPDEGGLFAFEAPVPGLASALFKSGSLQ